jgi:hypothetical protein
MDPHTSQSFTQIAAAMSLVGHPLRVVILGRLIAGEASPNGLFKQLEPSHAGLTLGQLAYHFRTLAAEGKIRLARTEPVRGTEQHFYELDEAGCELLRQIGMTGEPLHEHVHRGLRDRGWELDGGYVDPEGNRHSTLAAALDAQTAREAAGESRVTREPVVVYEREFLRVVTDVLTYARRELLLMIDKLPPRTAATVRQWYSLDAPGEPAAMARNGRPAIADVQADVERAYAASDADVYGEEHDERQWAAWTAGADVDMAEAVAAGADYAQRWAHDGVPVSVLVQGAYVCGLVVGDVRARRGGP